MVASRAPRAPNIKLWVLGQVRGGLGQVEALWSSVSVPRTLLPDSARRPAIVLIAQSTAFRWESSVGISSFLNNWRVECPPLSAGHLDTCPGQGCLGSLGTYL